MLYGKGKTWRGIAATKEKVATNLHEWTRIITDFNGLKRHKKTKVSYLGIET